ncbi:ammonium transporter, partial [bacterium]|nr:ammonium transporter [bacterium]
QLLYGKVDVTFALNGALAGLVSITAEPLMPTAYSSMLIGGVGGLIAVFGTQFIASLKIDDVVGALPVHLIAGIWGTIAVAITNPDTSFITQAIGAFSVVIFVFIVSSLLWSLLKVTVGVRPTEDEELLGSDKSEVGIEAYTSVK